MNDRDGLTDMTLLHYCCKAGAPGIGECTRTGHNSAWLNARDGTGFPPGASFPASLCPGDAETAAGFARQLLSLGADPNLRSRWTNMRALHYAAYFDVPQLIRVVSQASQPVGESTAAVSGLTEEKVATTV